jgi:hypothetical protein
MKGEVTVVITHLQLSLWWQLSTSHELRWDSRGGSRSGSRDPGLQDPWIPGKDLGPGQIPQIYSNRLNFFDVPCPETSCHASCFPSLFGPHRKRFLEVQTEIHSHMTSDQNTLFQEATTSAKRNLISVGGCTDTPLDLTTGGNTDGKRPCLGNGQTVLMRTPTQDEFVECWSEVIIRNGLPPALVDDPLTLPHRQTFTRKITPAAKRLDEENMTRVKSKMQKVVDTIMSDG